jgi:hypothetical protein
VAKPSGKTVKATFTLGVELVARCNAAALLRGKTRDAFASAALDDACKGLVLFDRVIKPSRSESKGSDPEASDVDNSGVEAA